MIKKQSRTCIAIIKDKKGKLVMAGDRRSSWDYSQAQSMPKPKISSVEGMLFGGTGNAFICSLIVDQMMIPDIASDNIDTYMFQIYRPQVVKLLKSTGFIDDKNILKIPPELDTEIIIGLAGRVYSLTIFNPDPLSENPNGLVAIDECNVPYATGCGGQLAWGSLLSTQGDDITQLKLKLAVNFNILKTPKHIKTLEEYRLFYALQVAAQVSPGCDSNVDIVKEL